MSPPKLFPIQALTRNKKDGCVREEVYMRAYEVYSAVYGPQQAMIENGCRGGFGTGELVAFLYAYPFQKSEWKMRVDEAFDGANLT